jgi:hypothetical protein
MSNLAEVFYHIAGDRAKHLPHRIFYRAAKTRTSGRDTMSCGFCKCSRGIGRKLEAWLTGSEFFSASRLKLRSVLAGGLVLDFQLPCSVKQPAGGA